MKQPVPRAVLAALALLVIIGGIWFLWGSRSAEGPPPMPADARPPGASSNVATHVNPNLPPDVPRLAIPSRAR